MFWVSKDDNTIEFNATVAPSGGITGTIKYNGTVVVNITGDADAPVFTGAGGRVLTPEERDDLLAIFDAAGAFLEDLTDGQFGPAEIVFR